MPFYSGLKPNGVVLINSDTPIKLVPDEERELRERNAKIFYLPATVIAREKADTDLATNMAMVGAISAIMGIPDLPSLEQSVKERFLGKGFVVSGGTAALDNVIERKFAKKEQLLKKNMEVISAAYHYALDHKWVEHKEVVTA